MILQFKEIAAMNFQVLCILLSMRAPLLAASPFIIDKQIV